MFAIAFVRYLQYFIPLGFVDQILIKGLFFSVLTYSNIRGVKAADRINDALTIVKLSPLVLLVLAGRDLMNQESLVQLVFHMQCQ